jgi:hypothetical protein
MHHHTPLSTPPVLFYYRETLLSTPRSGAPRAYADHLSEPPLGATDKAAA